MTTVALRDNRVASYSQTVPSRRTIDDEKRRNHLNSGYSGLDFRLMLPTSRTWAKKERIAMVSAVIGLVGGFIGATSGALALWDRWRHRRPQLRLSIPSAFRVQNGNLTTLCTLLRISNNRRVAAPLYVETMKPYVRSNRKWHEVKINMMSVAGKPGARPPGMDDTQAWLSGIEEVSGLKRFTDNIVEFDRPLTGYLALVSPDVSLLESADAVKFLIEDCHGKTLTLQANLPRGERVH